MSFNFGPSFKKDYPVLQVVKEIQKNISDFKYKIKKNKLFKKKKIKGSADFKSLIPL